MRHRAATAAVLAALAVVAARATAGDPPAAKVAIKLDRRPAAGERIRITETVKDANLQRVKEPGKPEAVERNDEERELAYEREVIELERGRIVTKERRTFTKFRLKRDKEEDRSLEGKTVFLTRGAGSGAEVEEKAQPGALALDYLSVERQREDDEMGDNPFAPPAELAPGESWAIDLPKFIAKFGPPWSEQKYDYKASKGTGTLKRVIDRDGAKFGELAIDVKLKCQSFYGADVVDGGIFTLSGTFEACIDGTRPDCSLDLARSFSARVKTDGEKGPQEVTFSFETSVKETRELIREPASKPAR